MKNSKKHAVAKVSGRELCRRTAEAFNVAESTARKWQVKGYPIHDLPTLALMLMHDPDVSVDVARAARKVNAIYNEWGEMVLDHRWSTYTGSDDDEEARLKWAMAELKTAASKWAYW